MNEMHNMIWNGMGGWMFLWWIIPVVILVGVGSVIFRNGNIGRERSALEILKERYAKGEIAKQEFEEKKRDIQ